jgi:hypothetical protein
MYVHYGTESVFSEALHSKRHSSYIKQGGGNVSVVTAWGLSGQLHTFISGLG